MKLTRRDFATAVAAGIVAPYVISSARAQGAATLKIGMCAPVTGPAAESGGYAIKGAKLALDAVNKAGGVLDHPASRAWAKSGRLERIGSIGSMGSMSSRPNDISAVPSRHCQ